MSIRIRLKYPDVDTFIQKYAANISKGGMFIQSRAPQSVGTPLRFEVLLQDRTTVLEGEGHVIWVKEYDAAHPARVHGMGVRFSYLTEESELLVERVMIFKAGEGFSQLESSRTQQVRNLLLDALPPTSEEFEELSSRAASPFAPRQDTQASPAEAVEVAPAPLSGGTTDEWSGDRRQDTPAEGEPAPLPPADWDRLKPAVLAPEPLDDASLPPPLDEDEAAEQSYIELPGQEGVTQLLFASERQLTKLMMESDLSEHQLLATLAQLAVAAPSSEQIEAMEQLLAPIAPVRINPADALSILRAGLKELSARRPGMTMRKLQLPGMARAEDAPSLGPTEVTPVVGAPPPSMDLDTDPDQQEDQLGELAQRAAVLGNEAHAPDGEQLSEQAFDQSEAADHRQVGFFAEEDLSTDRSEDSQADPTRFEPQGFPAEDVQDEPPPASESEKESDPTCFDPINPSLLHAAARSASLGRQGKSDSHFDLSDPEAEMSSSSRDEFGLGSAAASEAPFPDPAAPAADQGWSEISTSTEFLDHNSAVLQEMATYASAISTIDQLAADTLEESSKDQSSEYRQLPPPPRGEELSQTQPGAPDAQEGQEVIPTLEDLARLSPAPDQGEEGAGESEEPFEIKPRKSGLFERIFGKKD